IVNDRPTPAPNNEVEATAELARNGAVLRSVKSSPTPTPTQAQQVQMASSSELGHLFQFIASGESHSPEALGVAINLDNDQYVVRAIVVEPTNAKSQPLPFIPQMISGPAIGVAAATVLPDDTDVVVTASIDFRQTYEGMRR